MKIRYNSPVILTYSLLAICVLLLAIFGGYKNIMSLFSTPPRINTSNPLFYFRLFSYILGHAGWNHLIGNLMLILLVGPLLEEKYGSFRMLEMILVTALVTSLLNLFFFSTGIMGGSGIAFMLILLSSFANIRSGEIPLTFIIIAFLYLGAEVAGGLKPDNVSQFGHIAGGAVGGVYGFLRVGRR